MITNKINANWISLVKDIKGERYILIDFPGIAGVNGYCALKVPEKATKKVETSPGNNSDLYIL
jgi:hypothetical protein